MKLPFLLVVTTLALLSANDFSQSAQKTETASAQLFSFSVPEGDIKVHFGEKKVYMIDYNKNDGVDPSFWDGSLFCVEFMGISAKDNKNVSINNKSYPVSLWSSNPKILEFEKDNSNGLGGVFNISDAGKSTVAIAVQGKKSYLSIEAVKLPIRAGMLPSAIVKAIGTPDSRVDNTSEGKRINRINGKVIEVYSQSWTYKKYPGLRLIVDPIAGLDGWRMEDWDKVEERCFR